VPASSKWRMRLVAADAALSALDDEPFRIVLASVRGIQAMSDNIEGRQMGEWQAATIALLVAVVIAAIAWAAIDPDGLTLAADEAVQYWMKLHDQQFGPHGR
jgi:hypothetical protein